MKRNYILLVILLMASLAINAQEKYNTNIVNKANAYIEYTAGNISLSAEEKMKLFDLKCEHTSQFFQASAEFKDKPELDEKRKEVNLIYQKSVIAAFGRERALEIFKAARPK
jgi:hypothetical protein